VEVWVRVWDVEDVEIDVELGVVKENNTTLEEVEEADDEDDEDDDDDVVVVVEVLLVVEEVMAEIEELVEDVDGARLGDAAAARTVTNGL